MIMDPFAMFWSSSDPVISLVALVATMKKINRGYPNENMVVQLFSVPIR
jgi:hypothetical protein